MAYGRPDSSSKTPLLIVGGFFALCAVALLVMRLVDGEANEAPDSGADAGDAVAVVVPDDAGYPDPPEDGEWDTDSLDEETRRIIQKRQPLVEVVVWDDRAELTVIEKGPKHNMTYDEAFELCGRRYCKCARGKGKCKGKRYEKCMEARGHMTAADLCGDQF